MSFVSRQAGLLLYYYEWLLVLLIFWSEYSPELSSERELIGNKV